MELSSPSELTAFTNRRMQFANMENAEPKKKTPAKVGRGAAFLPQDDVQLCRSWVAVSEDPVKGTDQSKELFWATIREHGEFMARTPDSLRQRWGTISRAVSKFSGIMSTVTNLNKSGTNDEDKLNKALELFKQDEKKEFKFLDCFEVLSRCPKFRVNSEEKVNQITGLTTAASSSAVATAGSPTVRPAGRDKSKGAQLVASLEARRAAALERIAEATERKTRVFDEYRKAYEHQNFIAIATTRLDDLDPISKKILLIEKKRVLNELTSNVRFNSSEEEVPSVDTSTNVDGDVSVEVDVDVDTDFFSRFIEYSDSPSDAENASEV